MADRRLRPAAWDPCAPCWGLFGLRLPAVRWGARGRGPGTTGGRSCEGPLTRPCCGPLAEGQLRGPEHLAWARGPWAGVTVSGGIVLLRGARSGKGPSRSPPVLTALLRARGRLPARALSGGQAVDVGGGAGRPCGGGVWGGCQRSAQGALVCVAYRRLRQAAWSIHRHPRCPGRARLPGRSRPLPARSMRPVAAPAPRGTRQHCGTGLGAPETGTSPPESTDIQKRGPRQTATKALFAERSSSFRRRWEVPRCPVPVPGDAPEDGLGVRRPAPATGECTHAGPRGALPLCGFSTPRGDRASGTDLAGGLRTSGSGAESEGRAHRAVCGPRARDSGAKPLSALAWGPLTLACEPGERCRRGTAWGKTTLPLRGEACSWFPPASVVRGSGDLRPWPAEASWPWRSRGTVTVAGPLPDGQHLLPGQLRLLHRRRGSRAARQAADGRRGVALVTGPGRAPKPQNVAASEAGHRGLFSGCLQAQRCLQEGEPPDQGARVAAVCT